MSRSKNTITDIYIDGANTTNHSKAISMDGLDWILLRKLVPTEHFEVVKNQSFDTLRTSRQASDAISHHRILSNLQVFQNTNSIPNGPKHLLLLC